MVKCAPSEKMESDRAETIGGRRFLNQTTTIQKMEFVVGDYRGGRATAVDGVRGSVLACLGRRYRRQKIKIQYVMALERQQNITTNQMYAGAMNEEKDMINESWGGAWGNGDTIVGAIELSGCKN